MSKPDSWLPLYVADYLADTTRLTTEQHGAYMLIIMDYWRNGPPPNDDNVLARITGLSTRRWKAHRGVIQAFFSVIGGKWRHKRIDAEIERASENQRKRTERARQGAEARWAKDDNPDAASNAAGSATSMPQAMLVQCPSPSPTPSSLPTPPPETGSAPPEKAARPEKDEAKTAKTWDAYADAYRERYSVDPTPNATVRSQLSRFIDRVGKEDAPGIAAFYVRHNKAFYVSRQHPVGLLLSDAEGLRTQWLNGRTVTDTQARQADRKQSNLSVAEKLIAEARNADN